MHHYNFSMLLAVAASSPTVLAQNPTASSIEPLASKHFDYKNLPYQADPDFGIRGTQSGYNRCNSTTENQQSMCQTLVVNSIDDFCIWAPPKGLTTIGETEHEEVAWCTRPGHGSRIIPPGAMTGVQFMKTPGYVQVVGFIDQTKINLASGDYGGELDPHGADLRGNPLGGLVYSNAWSGDGSYQQVIEWHNFMGGNSFCIKACDPRNSNAAHFCEHIFDRIGCAYNAPNHAQNQVFVSCDGDDQDFPGVYTDASGQVQTYTQPPESLGPITTMPYQARVPASSNCVTYPSAALYGAASTDAAPVFAATEMPRPNDDPPFHAAVGDGSSNAFTLVVTSLSTVFGVTLAVVFFS